MFLISSVELTNFKRFSSRSFTFDPGFNLIVLPNGGGKTSFVEGVGCALVGPTALPGPVDSIIREGSLGPSYVAIKGVLRGSDFELVRKLRPRSTILKYDDVKLTKRKEVESFLKENIVQPSLIRPTLLCFQREADLIARAPAKVRRQFVMSLLRLDVIEKAVKSLSSPSAFTSLNAIEQQLTSLRQELKKLEHVSLSQESHLRNQLYLLQMREKYIPGIEEHRAKLQDAIKTCTILRTLLQTVLGVDSQVCPVCGSGSFSKDFVKTKLAKVEETLFTCTKQINSLPPPCTIDPNEFSKIEPGLSIEACQRDLDLISQKRAKIHTLTEVESILKKARESQTVAKARDVLRGFLDYLSTPLIQALSEYVTQILKGSGLFTEFKLDPSFNIFVDGRSFDLFSTGQRDFIAVMFRIAASYLMMSLYGCPRMPIFLDSVGDSLDEVYYSALMSYLSGGATKLFSQVFVTSHRAI